MANLLDPRNFISTFPVLLVLALNPNTITFVPYNDFQFSPLIIPSAHATQRLSFNTYKLKAFPLFSLVFLFSENAHDFSLHFPSNDTSNFVVFDSAIQPLDEFTICLWLKTTAKNTLSIFSYGTTFYLQCIDTGKCVLGIEGNER